MWCKLVLRLTAIILLGWCVAYKVSWTWVFGGHIRRPDGATTSRALLASGWLQACSAWFVVSTMAHDWQGMSYLRCYVWHQFGALIARCFVLCASVVPLMSEQVHKGRSMPAGCCWQLFIACQVWLSCAIANEDVTRRFVCL